VKAVTRRQRRMNAAASFNDTAVVKVPIQEKQSKTEGEDYEAIERLIDSISRDFSRKGINSRLKALVKKSSINVATICDHILAVVT
jgi:pyruvate/2-oxoglutarate dehydrogenase complex dihydrolipoamide dehydrogenase (E3) component